MQYHEAQAQHAAAHPFIVERWSESTLRWVFVAEHKSHESAERQVAMHRVLPAYADAEFRIIEREAER